MPPREPAAIEAPRARPLTFTAPSVLGIYAGTKTQTRRLIGLDTLRPSTTPGYDWTWRGQAPIRSIAQQRRHPAGCWQDVRHRELIALCPHGAPGDRIWVRETWATLGSNRRPPFVYRADTDGERVRVDAPWRSPRFMPRAASRLTLEIVDVRVERVQWISADDVFAEGLTILVSEDRVPLVRVARLASWKQGPKTSAEAIRLQFADLWDDINAKRGAGWDANPWVWALTFRRLDVSP